MMSAEEMEAAVQTTERYISSVVGPQMQPDERMVPISEFARCGDANAESEPTALACPVCRALLWWRHTGIS
jgi:hypothetical protein